MSTAAELAAIYAAELDEAPELRPFIEDGDVDLEAARERFACCVRDAKLELHSRGVTVHRRAVTPSGLQTTMLAVGATEGQTSWR